VEHRIVALPLEQLEALAASLGTNLWAPEQVVFRKLSHLHIMMLGQMSTPSWWSGFCW
jgi:hypothetical protein